MPPPLRPLALATLLIALGAAHPALGQACAGLCPAQAVDQEILLSPFNALLDTPAGRAALQANLQTEVDIYLHSTQAQKIAAGTALIVPFLPQNILLRAFPGNASFYYDAAGLPTAPPLPGSITGTVNDITNNAQFGAMKADFGGVDVYTNAYGILPGQADPIGNPTPYQVSLAILNNPFTAANASALAAANQQTAGTYGVNWQVGAAATGGDFPSAHTLASGIEALTYAVLAPGYYQQFLGGAADFAYDLNVYAAHYPLDVIGGRILAIYVTAQTLAGNSLYPSATGLPGDLGALRQAMQGYLDGVGLGNGGSSPYAAACAGNVAGCVANGTIPLAASYAQQMQAYTWLLTYGLPPVGDTTLAPVVPAGAATLIATRFPYLSTDQLNQVLATTELPSGTPLDNGTGWARLNLYAAAAGYGAFPDPVTVTMNAASGGLNAFDIWSNAIGGPGSLTLQGSGTLVLAGNDSYGGGTVVQGGTLAVTGTLRGDLAIAPGATFVSNGGYAVAGTATLSNAGTFVETTTPLVNAGSAHNTGVVIGDVTNRGSFGNDGLVSGAFTNLGMLSGNGTVGALALLAGSTVAPGHSVGTIHVAGDLTVATGATYQAQFGATGADLIQVNGRATLSGGSVLVSSVGSSAALGTRWPILTAGGGISGSFASLVEPAGGLAAGTRFDTLYGANAVTLIVTPASYAGLSAAGLRESRSESAVGGALDAIRPAPGSAMASTRSALFGPLYSLPPGSLGAALDQLAPSIYADGLITARNSWYLVTDAIGEQLAARRGLSGGQATHSTPGPNGSTIWAGGLAGYNSVGSAAGSPGFTAGLGGAAAGIDMQVADTARLGVAVAAVHGKTWSQAGGQATANTTQFVTYGQWLRGRLFAEGQLGLMSLQQDVHRTMALFGSSARGDSTGLASGGGARLGVQQPFGRWLIEPSFGFGGFGLHVGHATETTGGPLAQTIGGASLGSAQSTLAVSAQRRFAVAADVQVTTRLRLGWSHEFADDAARIAARFTGLSGSGFALNSAPIGRDAAVVGVGADVKVASWPLTVFVGYGGAVNASSNAQSVSAGLDFLW